MSTQTYHQASEHFPAQARGELSDGGLTQASEKGWGTAAQILKAVAEQRGWEHEEHRHLSRVASRLRADSTSYRPTCFSLCLKSPTIRYMHRLMPRSAPFWVSTPSGCPTSDESWQKNPRSLIALTVEEALLPNRVSQRPR